MTRYTPSQNQAAKRATSPPAEKWKRSRCSSVAVRVSAVNTSTVMTGTRACAQARVRSASTISRKPAP